MTTVGPSRNIESSALSPKLSIKLGRQACGEHCRRTTFCVIFYYEPGTLSKICHDAVQGEGAIS